MFLGLILLPMMITVIYEKMNEENIVFKNCMYISVLLVLFGSWLPEYQRFVYYFFIPSIVYVPYLLEGDKNKKTEWMDVIDKLRSKDLSTYSVTEAEYEMLQTVYKWLSKE